MRQDYHAMKKEAIDHVLVAMIAEVLLICAATLAFFVQFNLPVTIATGCALVSIFAGSLLCWKSQAASFAILGISLLAVEIMLALRFPVLIFPFALVDVLLVMVLSGAWHTSEQH
jgi:hypothetical protein